MKKHLGYYAISTYYLSKPLPMQSDADREEHPYVQRGISTQSLLEMWGARMPLCRVREVRADQRRKMCALPVGDAG